MASNSYTAKEVAQWLAERLANCQVIADNKDPGADRDGWLEDANYLRAALHLVADGQCGPSLPHEPTTEMLEAAGEAYFATPFRPIHAAVNAALQVLRRTHATGDRHG